MTNLGILTVPKQIRKDLGNGVGYAFNGQHFDAPAGLDVEAFANSLTAPLSVITQVTKLCDMDCGFCSEVMQKKDPTLKELETMEENLRGVARVFLSGSEPLLRRDFIEIVDMYAAHHIVAVPTNATHGLQHAARAEGARIAWPGTQPDGARARVGDLVVRLSAVVVGAVMVDGTLHQRFSVALPEAPVHRRPPRPACRWPLAVPPGQQVAPV
ncbi:radical SAM protein [Streptomyces mirabilis]|uniref:radical SAM protein n=1 Tax=Streptomyces mirabilis TaxID=68239 RepID=UPI0036EEB272